jgi:GAF domain-containing protein
MLEKAMRLCEAAFGSLYTYDGERFHSAAQRGVPPEYAAYRERNPPTAGAGGDVGAVLKTRLPQHRLDVKEHELYRAGDPGVRAMVELGGIRTVVIVPLVKGDEFLGFFSVYRQEVRAFSDKEIAQLENFAAQAVIAMENARLITETREALEQQTATAEVLQVINSSPSDLAPVFDTMLDKAIRLCDAILGVLWLIDGQYFHVAAAQGLPPDFLELLRQCGNLETIPPLRRIMGGERLIHFLDTKDTGLHQSGHPLAVAAVEANVRTLIWVALVREGTPLGAFAIGHREVRPFTDQQIALLENFAAQAVIAMENARLLGELRQRTDQVAKLNRGLEARVADRSRS